MVLDIPLKKRVHDLKNSLTKVLSRFKFYRSLIIYKKSGTFDYVFLTWCTPKICFFSQKN